MIKKPHFDTDEYIAEVRQYSPQWLERYAWYTVLIDHQTPTEKWIGIRHFCRGYLVMWKYLSRKDRGDAEVKEPASPESQMGLYYFEYHQMIAKTYYCIGQAKAKTDYEEFKRTGIIASEETVKRIEKSIMQGGP